MSDSHDAAAPPITGGIAPDTGDQPATDIDVLDLDAPVVELSARRAKRGTPRVGLADALFSRTLQGILAALLAEPQRTLNQSELVERVGHGNGSVLRQLEALEWSGHVLARRVGNQKRYRANPESPIFEELRGIAVKTFAVVEPLRAAMGPLEWHIAKAWLRGMGSAGEQRAWGDFELVAVLRKLPEDALAEALESVDLGRTIRLKTFTEDEWERADRRTREHYAGEPRLMIFDHP